MKAALSLLALSSIFAGAFAAPTPDFPTQPTPSNSVAAFSNTSPSHAPAVPETPTKHDVSESQTQPDVPETQTEPDVPEAPTELDAPETPSEPEYSPEEFISKFEVLMTNVKEHTAAINATMKSFKEGQDKTIVAGLVKSELIAIFTAVAELKEALAVIPVVVGFTVEQVHTLALIIFAIIFEIAATVAGVLKVLGIQVLLFGILGQLAVVLSILVHIVESIVGGVLVIVNSLISIDGAYTTIGTVFAGLPLALAKGEMVGL